MSRKSMIAGVLVAMGLLLPAAAQAQWFVDDFEDGSATDGNPVQWIPYIDPWSQGGLVEVVDGNLMLTPDANAPPFPGPEANPDWIEADALADDRRFQNVSIHTLARVSGTDYGVFGVGARDTWNDSPSAFGINVFAGVSFSPTYGPRIHLGGNTPAGMWPTTFVPTSLNMHEADIHLELSVFGDVATAYAWEDGQQKPARPQLTRELDSSQLVSGRVSLWYGQLRPPVNELNTAAFRFVEVERIAGMYSVGVESIYTVIDDDRDSAFDDHGDTASNRLSQPAAGVGEADSESNNAMSRLVARFDLPNSPTMKDLLKSATLRFFLEETTGTPAGPVSVFHSVSSNELPPSPMRDYEDDSFADTGLDLVQPTDPGQAYYELDVTEAVLADYAQDGADPISAFRLQINEAEFFEDNLSHRYVFTMPGAEANHPELVLTFIPEPSTIALGGLAVLGLLAGRWRRTVHAA